MRHGITYLAVPYSHPDPAVRQARFETVNEVAARMMAEGHYVFSPISHTHPIAMAGDLPKGWEFWSEYDRQMLMRCSRLVVLMLDGWRESVGVQAEIRIASGWNMPIEYVEA